jgi:hypothetical protein
VRCRRLRSLTLHHPSRICRHGDDILLLVWLMRFRGVRLLGTSSLCAFRTSCRRVEKRWFLNILLLGFEGLRLHKGWASSRCGLIRLSVDHQTRTRCVKQRVGHVCRPHFVLGVASQGHRLCCVEEVLVLPCGRLYHSPLFIGVSQIICDLLELREYFCGGSINHFSSRSSHHRS